MSYLTKNQIVLFLLTLNMLPKFADAQKDSTQVEKPWYERGKVYGTIYSNAHTSITSDNKEKAFEVTRAYFGYEASVSDNLSANIKIDIGSPDDVQNYAAKKRFAYFKNAYVQYKLNNLKIQFGIADCFQFNMQEKFWGYRYIYMSLQDKHKYGSSADIGIFTYYKFNTWLSGDASLVNGEGYNTIQNDETFKGTLGATLNIIKPLWIRLYFDAFTMNENSQYTLATFIGYRVDKFSLGAEYNYQINTKFIDNQNMTGLSFYTNYQIHKKHKVFARYDYQTSNIVDGDEVPWNLARDGSALITGYEFTPHKSLNLSLNYQDWIASAADGADYRYLYFNLQFNF